MEGGISFFLGPSLGTVRGPTSPLSRRLFLKVIDPGGFSPGTRQEVERWKTVSTRSWLRRWYTVVHRDLCLEFVREIERSTSFWVVPSVSTTKERHRICH